MSRLPPKVQQVLDFLVAEQVPGSQTFQYPVLASTSLDRQHIKLRKTEIAVLFMEIIRLCSLDMEVPFWLWYSIYHICCNLRRHTRDRIELLPFSPEVAPAIALLTLENNGIGEVFRPTCVPIYLDHYPLRGVLTMLRKCYEQ
jgi:hypothetical protein